MLCLKRYNFRATHFNLQSLHTVEADLTDPHGHHVGVGRAVVQVEDNHTQDDRARDQDHCEHDVLDDDGNAK